MAKKDVVYSVPFEIKMLPVVVSGVEKSAEIFGFDHREKLGLVLAVDEVFSFIASNCDGSGRMEITCRDCGHYVQTDCRVPQGHLPLEALNMTSSVGEDNLDQMGFILASRTTDRFSLSIESGVVVLSFIKKRIYPEVTGEPSYPDPDETMVIGPVAQEDWPSLLYQVRETYGDISDDFFYPGCLASMVASGDLMALSARSPRGRLGGLVMWTLQGRIASLQGPFCFGENDDLSSRLLDQCISSMGRGNAVGITVINPVDKFPSGYFEDLTGDGRMLFRYLSEDNGSLSWVSDSVRPFVESCYDRMELPRDVRSCSSSWQDQAEKSLFSVSLDHSSKKAVLTPLIIGEDSSENLSAHLKLLMSRGYSDVALNVDLGRADLAPVADAAVDAGFAPVALIPWGGEGDLLRMEPVR